MRLPSQRSAASRNSKIRATPPLASNSPALISQALVAQGATRKNTRPTFSCSRMRRSSSQQIHSRSQLKEPATWLTSWRLINRSCPQPLLNSRFAAVEYSPNNNTNSEESLHLLGDPAIPMPLPKDKKTLCNLSSSKGPTSIASSTMLSTSTNKPLGGLLQDATNSSTP